MSRNGNGLRHFSNGGTVTQTTKGGVEDGSSWSLVVFVTDLQVERSLRVNGDLHIGGLMINLVDELDIAMDWSDHALWWPKQNIWLDKTRWTLDQYNIGTDSQIQFTPMHKAIRIQLPDLRYIDCSLNFSIKMFGASIDLCKQLGISHPEELSLSKPLEKEHLKHNYQETVVRRSINLTPTKDVKRAEPNDTNTFISNSSSSGSQIRHLSQSNIGGGSLNGTLLSTPRNGITQYHSNPGTLRNAGGSSYLVNGSSPHHYSRNSPTGSENDISLAHSPSPGPDVRSRQLRPKSLAERARMNVGWLDSSLSLMEQGVREFDTLLLRFKYYAYYELNMKQDSVRMNQIYEQAKWQILNEEIDCTEEEMMLFAALQVQISLEASNPQNLESSEDEDDVDAALSELQISLEGGSNGNFNGNRSKFGNNPQLTDYLQYLKPKRYTLKSFRRIYFICRDLNLIGYKSAEHASGGSQGDRLINVSLKGCDVTPDLNLSLRRYRIKLQIPSTEGMNDLWIQCDQEEQYVRWLAAFRMASKGKTMADSNYETEVKEIKSFLTMQQPAQSPAINPLTMDISVEDYVANRFLRRGKSKLRQKIMEAHSNVKNLSLRQAKFNFIKSWQSLPDYGISLFVVRFHGERKDELLGITANKLMKMSLSSGDHLKSWRFSTMKAWNINWQTRHMMIQLDDQKNVIFHCQSAECKVVHEFLGGYIFLSMRSRDTNQTLNEKLFHKLTGGWS